MENVCISVDDDSFMYAVGSKAHTDLLDARTLQVNDKTLSRLHTVSRHLFSICLFLFIHNFYFNRKLDRYHHETMAVEFVQFRLKAIY